MPVSMVRLVFAAIAGFVVLITLAFGLLILTRGNVPPTAAVIPSFMGTAATVV